MGWVQPCAPAATKATDKAVRLAVNVSRPGQSSPGVIRIVGFGRAGRAGPCWERQRGHQHEHRTHPKVWVNAPAAIGPSANPVPKDVPRTPKAIWRWRPTVACASIAAPAANTPAAPPQP